MEFVLVQTVPWLGSLLRFCLGKRYCWCRFSCAASLRGHVLGHAELLWVPDISIQPHTSVSAGTFVWCYCSSALLYTGQAMFQFSVFKSKDESVRDGG